MENLTQRTIQNLSQENSLANSLYDFLIDRKASELSPRTLDFYKEKIEKFFKFCLDRDIQYVTQITAGEIREYMLYMAEVRNNNKGNIHGFYRSIRAFLNWYEQEFEPDGWPNPIKKVKAPKVPIEPLEPISFEDITRMINTCIPGKYTGDRDKAILLFFLDTGVRAQEGLSVNLEDINIAKGEVLIRHGKGNKPRYVYFSKQTRRAIRKYLRHRSDDNPALWCRHPRFDIVRLRYGGLREILKRRAHEAGVKTPGVHAFRRAFALSMLRNGTDIFTLAKLMGHKGISVLQRYLRQTNEDTANAHRRASPVEVGLQMIHRK